MNTLHRASPIHPLRLVSIAALLLATPLVLAVAANASTLRVSPPKLQPARSKPAASQPVVPSSQAAPDHSASYYHYGLAQLYEELAVSAGLPDYATQAVEQYKLALDADPNSAFLQDGLADLYFKVGRIDDAVNTAQERVKQNPDDLEAHTLLGQIYLRSLGNMQGPQASQSLHRAITEYEAVARLKPDDLETRLLLGQLYALDNNHAKAEAEFKAAQKIDPSSQEVALDMARLYSQEGDLQHAADTLAALPVEDRTARTELALGLIYDQLKKPKLAAMAYRSAVNLAPDNTDAQRGLANALLLDGQLDEALKVFNQLLAANPTDTQSQIRIAEIERRQGNYDLALTTLEKAKTQIQDSPNLAMELNYNEALLYDTLGKYDQAVGVLTDILDSTAKPDGKYSDQEKQNRAIFLDRLGIISREQGKTAEAVAAYKQIVDFGGDYRERGYDGEIDAYRDAHQWKDATAAAAAAAKAMPKDHSMQLTYAGQLADVGQVDAGIALAKAQLTGTQDDRSVHEALAQIYIRLKRFKEASAQLDKVDAMTGMPETIQPAKTIPPGIVVAQAASPANRSNSAAPGGVSKAAPGVASSAAHPSAVVKPVAAVKPDYTPNDQLYALFLRGEMYDRQKMRGQAEVEFRKALAIDANNAAVLNYLGFMLADAGEKLPEALKLIQKAVNLEPQNGAYLDSLGWVYFKLGQYPQAEANMHKAIERMNNDPTVLYHLGEVYAKTGNLKMAVEQWQRSMAEYAQSLPADADPEDVQRVQRKLEDARVKLAKLTTASNKGTR